jgi:hypothetical protein
MQVKGTSKELTNKLALIYEQFSNLPSLEIPHDAW